MSIGERGRKSLSRTYCRSTVAVVLEVSRLFSALPFGVNWPVRRTASISISVVNFLYVCSSPLRYDNPVCSVRGGGGRRDDEVPSLRLHAIFQDGLRRYLDGRRRGSGFAADRGWCGLRHPAGRGRPVPHLQVVEGYRRFRILDVARLFSPR